MSGFSRGFARGTWTPVLTFQTANDQNIAYSAQQGDYRVDGDEVLLRFRVITSTFTHSTAAGDLQMTGLPFSVSSANPDMSFVGACMWRGVNRANYSQVMPRIVQSAGAFITFYCSGMNVAPSNLAVADLPSGGATGLPFFIGWVQYRMA